MQQKQLNKRKIIFQNINSLSLSLSLSSFFFPPLTPIFQWNQRLAKSLRRCPGKRAATKLPGVSADRGPWRQIRMDQTFRAIESGKIGHFGHGREGDRDPTGMLTCLPSWADLNAHVKLFGALHAPLFNFPSIFSNY